MFFQDFCVGRGEYVTSSFIHSTVKMPKSGKSLLEVFCRKGRPPFLHQFFSTGMLDIRCESDDYEVLKGANATDISKQFAKMWGIKLINYPAFFKSR